MQPAAPHTHAGAQSPFNRNSTGRARRSHYATDADGAILINSPNQFERAIAKARELRPLVHVVRLGHYQVTKREESAKTYDVRLWAEGGQRKGKCSCAAGTPPVAQGRPRYAPRACYHLMAAIGRHMQLAIEAREAGLGESGRQAASSFQRQGALHRHAAVAA